MNKMLKEVVEYMVVDRLNEHRKCEKKMLRALLEKIGQCSLKVGRRLITLKNNQPY